MSANASRRDAGSNRLSLGSYVPDSVEGTPARQRWCNRVSAAVLEAADACDKTAGIYRVSLDAAIEAAARALCEQTGKGSDYAPGWDACTDKEMHRRIVRPLVTAAVMGGAQ